MVRQPIVGCGEHCQSCNEKFGCDICDAEPQLIGWVNAFNASDLLQYPTFKKCQAAYTQPSYQNDTNCFIYDWTSDYNCKECNDRYFPQLYSSYYDQIRLIYATDVYTCTINNDAYCFNPTDANSCNICQNSYGIQEYTASSSCLPCLGNTYNKDVATCNYTLNTYDEITACRDGFDVDDSCQPSCKPGYYGLAVFNYRAKLQQTHCYACAASCYECAGELSTQCKTCRSGYYLSLPDRNVQLGSCVQKTSGSATYSIYVAPITSRNSQSSDLITGTSSDPFNSIQDAIKYAYQLGATVTSATVTIYLKDGDHAMVRYYPSDFLMPNMIDLYSSSTKIIIQPATPDVTITINYKLRDSFKFLVGGSLTIQNIKFDAIDSTLDLDIDLKDQIYCSQNNSTYCCSVDTDGNLIGAASCVYKKKPQQNFTDISTNAAIRGNFLINCVNEILKNVIFSNFVYEYNSLIELNQYGGNIIIKNVIFDNMNSCGAIIRNKKSYVNKTNTVSDIKTYYQHRSNQYELELHNDYLDSIDNMTMYSASCSSLKDTYSSSPCFSITIQDSSFTNFGKMKSTLVYPIKVDPTYLLQYQGYILDLDQFNGTVTFKNNTVQNNFIKYSGCQSAQLLTQMTTDPLATTDKYSVYGTKSVYQIKSWLSIVNHGDWPVYLLNNNFKYNTAVKGIIYLDLGKRTVNSPLLIASNIFEQNAALIDATVINIRSRGDSSQDVFSDVPTNTALFCTGFHFELNTFYKNYGCTKYSGGPVKFECLNSDTADTFSNGQITFQDLSASNKNAYYAKDFRTFTASNKVVTYYSQTYTIDVKINRFKSNQYLINVGTGGKSLVTVIGSPRTYFQNETFIGNGDSSLETTQTFGNNGVYLLTDALYEKSGNSFHTDIAQDQSELMKSLILIQRHGQAKITDCFFEQNWMYEALYSNLRSQLVEIRNFYGQLTIDSLTVQNQYGPMNNALGPEALYGVTMTPVAFRETASVHPLFRFADTNMVKYVDNFKTISYFKNLQFQEQLTNTDSQLFWTYEVDSSNDYQHITDFLINNIWFEDIDCYSCTRPVLHIQALVTTLTNVTFININSNTQTNSLYSQAAFIKFYMRIPYQKTSSSATKTEYLTFNNVNVQNNYGLDGCRMFEIEGITMTYDSTPTVYQISIMNSNMTGLYTQGHSPTFKVSVNSIWMKVYNTSFSNITAGYLQIGQKNGGVFEIQGMSKILVEEVTVIDVYNPATVFDGVNTEGCGRFICYYNPVGSLSVNLTNSYLVGSTTPTYLQKSEDQIYQIENSLISQASMLDLRLDNYDLTVNLKLTTFINCSISQLGSTITITTLGSPTVVIDSSLFQNNAAIEGGALYCRNCSFNVYNTTFDTNVAKIGGDFVLMTPASSNLVYRDIISTGSLAIQNGATIYVNEQTGRNFVITIYKGTGLNSSFTDTYSMISGGSFYLNVNGNVQMDITDTFFENIAAKYNGGMVSIPDIPNSNSQVKITLQRCIFNNIWAETQNGGVFYVSQESSKFELVASNTIFTNINTINKGGLIYSGAQLELKATFSNVTINNITANDGSVIYSQSGSAIVSFTASSLISEISAVEGGALVHFDNSSATVAFTFSHSTIEDCKSISGNGGMINAIGNSVTFTFSDLATITNVNAHIASILYSNATNNYLTISNSVIEDFEALDETGGFYLNSQQTTSVTVNQATTIKNVTAPMNGGVFYINGTDLIVNIADSLVQDTSSGDFGGFMLTSTEFSTLTMTISNSQFHYSEAPQNGTFIFVRGSKYPKITFSISDSTFICQEFSYNVDFPTNYILMQNDLDQSQNMKAGLFEFDASVNGTITSARNEFKRCYNTYAGSIFNLPQYVKLIDTGSLYEENGGENGVISVNSSSVTMTGVTVVNSESKQASFIHMDNSATVYIDDLSMTYGKSRTTGGAFFIEGNGDASLTITNCNTPLEYFESTYEGGFIYNKNPLLNISISNCDINHVSAGALGGLFYLQSIRSFSLVNTLMLNITSFGDGIMIYSMQQGAIIEFSQIQLSCVDDSLYDPTLISLDVYRNTTTMGSVIYLKNVNELVTGGNSFRNCFTASQGAIYNLENSTLFDTDSSYTQISALEGGAFYLKDVNATFQGLSVTKSLAYTGGTFLLRGANILSITGLILDTSESYGDGGFLNIIEATKPNSISILGTTNDLVDIQNVASNSANGGLIFSDSPLLNITLGNAAVTNATAAISGGLLNLNNAQNVSIILSNIFNVSSKQNGSIIYSEAPDAYFIFDRTTFDCKGASFDNIDVKLTQLSYQQGGAFFLINSIGLSSTSNIYQNCYIAEKGGLFYITNTNFTETDSSYYNNAALYGGVYYCLSCNITAKNTKYVNSKAYIGGLIYYEDNVFLTLDNVVVNGATSINGGGLVYAKQYNSTSTSRIDFINGGTYSVFSSQYDGGCFYLDHNGLNLYLLNLLNFYDSVAVDGNGGLFYVKNAQTLLIQESTFSVFSASKNGSLIYSESNTLNLTLIGNILKGSSSPWTNYYGDDLGSPDKGGMIWVQDLHTGIVSTQNTFANIYISNQGAAFTLLNSSFVDTKSTYQYMKSKQGGAIYCDLCHLKLNGTIFDHNQATRGGSIYINDHQGYLSILDSSFTYQYASIEGSAIYFTGTHTGDINFTNTIVSNTESKTKGGAFYLDHYNSSITIDGMTLTTSYAKSDGGVFYIKNQVAMSISNSVFSVLSSDTKGSFMYSESTTLDLIVSDCEFSCKSTAYTYATDLQTTMESNNPTKTNSGAFYISGAAGIQSQSNLIQNCYLSEKGSAFTLVDTELLDNSTIYKSNAALEGGLFYASSSTIQILNTSVTNSYAISGGVIFLYNISPVLISNSIFTNNNAVKSGGFAYITELESPAGSYQFKVKFTTFTTSTSKISGGVFYVDSSTLDEINLHQVIITKSTAQQTGGVMHVKQMNGLLNISTEANGIQNQISEFSAQVQGSMLYSISEGFWIKMTNTLIKAKLSYVFNNIKTSLLATTTTYAGAFYIENSVKGLQSTKNTYINCYTAQAGGVFTFVNSPYNDSSSSYTQNAAITGGVIKCDGCTMNIEKGDFEFNLGQNGGVFYVDNFAQINITDSIVASNEAEVRGGVFLIQQTVTGSLTDTYIQMINCNTVRRNKATEGGLMYIENQYMNINLMSMRIQYIDASEKGGLMYIVKAESVAISSSRLSDFSAPAGAGFYSISQTVEIRLKENEVECNQLFDFTTIDEYLDLESPLSTLESNFFIQNAKQVHSDTNVFKSCALTSQGGVFSLYKTKFNDTKSKFYNNAGTQGGVFLVSQSSISLIESKLNLNYAFDGGAIAIFQGSSAYMFRCEFSTNIAYSSGGVIFLNTESYFDAVSSQFQYNEAPDSSAILILGGSKIYNSSIQGCSFLRNQAITNTISIMNGLMWIKSTTFEYNNATARSKNIFVGFSKLVIESSRFTSVQEYEDLTGVVNEETIGAFLFIIFDVHCTIFNSIFSYGRAAMGGAIYMSGDSILRIIQSQFLNNYSRSYGGAIFASGYDGLHISGNSYFRNNLAIEKGDDIFVTNSEKNFTLEKVNITNVNAVGSLYIELASVTLYQVGFVTIQGKGSLYGAALFCLNCRKINITESYFSKTRSKVGGAIYIQENELNKKKNDKVGKYRIVSSIFELNEATETGGAIYLDNAQYVLIDSSLFRLNIVKYSDKATNLAISGAGGALYYTCNDQILKCRLEISGNTLFIKNSAAVKGGAIYWDQLEPVFNGILYKDNTAKYYANNTGCFAQNLVLQNSSVYNYFMTKFGLLETGEESARRELSHDGFDEQENKSQEIITYNAMHWERELQESTLNTKDAKINNQRSGGAIPTIYLAHVDKYGQIVGSDFTSKVRVFVDITSITDPDALIYPPTVEGETLFTTKLGMAVAKDFNFAGAPGFTYSISFQSDGIDLSKQSNKNYMKNQNERTDLNTGISIALRECGVGEAFTSAGKCVKCPNGGGFSTTKMTKPGECTSCPSTKAICTGGAGIGPRPGYWRKNNITTTFLKCMYKPACLGMVAPQFSPIGSCADGYQKTLCADCKVGSSRVNEYECGICPDPTQNLIRLAFILVGIGAVVVLTVRSTLAGAKEKNNITSIFMKILLNHFQLILLTASFDFDWPDEVMKVFDTQKPVAQVSTQVISFDCFIDSRKKETNVTYLNWETPPVEGVRVFFIKLTLLAILPFLLLIVTVSFWFIYGLIKRQLGAQNQGKMVATMVIVLFLIHPNIVQYMFFNFKCLDISDELRVINDLEVLCWGEYHSLFSYFVAAPSIIVWGLGIPAFAFFVMRKNSKNLDSEDIRQKFGFLYRGYRVDYYYWEIVIMYRKIILIFIAAFVGNYGAIAQALIVFVLLIGFLLLSMKWQPYQSIALNDLEMLSLVTSMISVYCGLFFIANKPEAWIKDNPDYSTGSIALSAEVKLFFLAIIVIANLVFIIYWAVKMYYEVKAKLRKMMPKVYLMFCLCFNQRKLDRENREHEIALINEALKDKYLKNLEILRTLYFSGQIVLNDATLEKILAHLNPDKIVEIAQPLSVITAEQLMKIQKRKDRQKLNEDKKKEVGGLALGIGFVKVHDAKTAGVEEEPPVGSFKTDVDSEKLRLGSAKTNTTQPILEPKSDSLQIDEGFIEDDEETRKIREERDKKDGQNGPQHNSMIIKKTHKHDKRRKYSDSNFESGSSQQTIKNDANEDDALTDEPYHQQSIYKIDDSNDDDEMMEVASIGFSELDQYEKEQQEREYLERINQMAIKKEKGKDADNVVMSVRPPKIESIVKKKLVTNNLFDKIKFMMHKKEQLKEIIQIKDDDSVNRHIEIEDIDNTVESHRESQSSYRLSDRSNSYQNKDSAREKARLTHFSNFTSSKDQSNKNKQQQKKPQPYTPFNKKQFQRRDTIRDVLEEEKVQGIEYNINQAAQKRQKYKLGVKTESQMIRQPLTASNIEALISLKEDIIEQKVNSLLEVEQELNNMQNGTADKNDHNNVHEMISHLDLQIEDSFGSQENSTSKN